MELVSSQYCQGEKLDSSAKMDLCCNLGLFQYKEAKEFALISRQKVVLFRAEIMSFLLLK